MRLLDNKDFIIEGNILKPKLSGDSLILFFGKNCIHCPLLKESFKELEKHIGDTNIQLGIINLTLYKDVVHLSQATTTPIKYVPLILFYIDGIPYKEFSGNGTVENLINFIIEVQNKKQQQQPPLVIDDNVKPLSKKVCYLNYESAYGS